jgi:CO/xanthine dehydrogenase FAD-binding subunit
LKPAAFQYHAPRTVEEACALLAEYGDDAKVLAGGQSLVPLLSLRLASPAHVIDVNRIAGLDHIERTNGSLRIGALVRQADAERSPVVAAGCRMLSEALPLVAHVAIRNRGTVCGSLAHCDPAAEVPLIFAALGGRAVVRSARGERTIPASAFFAGYLQSTIEADELLVEMQLDVDGPKLGRAFGEVSRRHGDFATVAAAVSVRVDERGTVDRAAIAFGGVASTPVRVAAAEAALLGSDAAAAVEAVCEAVRHELDPVGDIHGSADYRRRVAVELVRSLVHTACERAQEEHG